jgi:hypothetical protein
VGKRNTGVLTSQERLNLGLLIPGRTFLQHMSVKHGRMFEYDPEFDELDWRMTNKEDSGDEAQGENMLSVKVEDSPRRVRQSSNKSSQIIRTQGVESWFIDETRIRYGFVCAILLEILIHELTHWVSIGSTRCPFINRTSEERKRWSTMELGLRPYRPHNH